MYFHFLTGLNFSIYSEVVVVVVVVTATVVDVVVVDQQCPVRELFNFTRISSRESPGAISKQDR